MAQTGFTPLLIYSSSTASAVPSAGNLTNSTLGAELAINIADGKLYYKDSGGTVRLLASNSASSPVTSFQTSLSGLTPSTSTTGAITLAGTLGVPSGGTGLTSVTSTYIPYGNGTSALQTSSSLTFNGTTLSTNTLNLTTQLAIAYGGTGQTSFTAGQIHFGSFSTSANLFWDNSNNRLGVNTNTPAVTSAFVGTDAVLIPVGTTGQRPTGATGYFRFNTTTSQFEGYNGTVWGTIGGGAALSNDTTTATNLYPLFAAATSGNPTTIYTSNANYLYKPSTGELQSLEVVATNGLFVNNGTVNASYTIPTGYNANSVGPITTASGVTVTVSSGSRWLVQ